MLLYLVFDVITCENVVINIMLFKICDADVGQ